MPLSIKAPVTSSESKVKVPELTDPEPIVAVSKSSSSVSPPVTCSAKVLLLLENPVIIYSKLYWVELII